MKLYLTIILVLTFACAVFAQDASNQAAKDSARLNKETEKSRKKNEKHFEKEKMSRPAQISINADREKVASMTVETLTSYGYTLDNESPRRLVFSRPLKGFGKTLAGQMAVGTRGGNAPRMAIAATINEVSGVTTVILDTGIFSNNIFGKTNSADLNKNKKIRGDLDSILTSVKTKSEQ